MLIPHDQLTPDALRRLIEDFVTVALKTKIEQVMRQLKNGEVVIAYNQDEAYCNIITKEDARNLLNP